MGLFSFSGKNKQDRTSQDSGRFNGGDEFAERARAKRASHAGDGARRGGRGGDDPVLPEKKRARRRLVGAIALALAAAVGLPMLLDSEPKPLAGDIAIQIPSKDKAAPLPVPAEPEAATQAPAQALPASGPQAAAKPVAAADSVDKGEEIVPAPKAAPAEPRAVAEVRAGEPPKPEHKAKPAEPKPAEKPAEKPVEKSVAKSAEKPAQKKEQDKGAHAAPADSARALAILEGKQAAKAADAGEKVTIQVAALGSQEKAAELQARLRAAGIHSFTEKVPGSSLVRVKVGPYSKEEAEKMHAKLAKIR